MVTPRQRPTVSECFHHPWIAQHSEPPSPSPLMLKVNIILFHQLKITIEITRFPPRIHLCRSSVSTPPPALGREGLVRHAGDHQACVQHLLHHFNPHQAPPDDHQNQGQVEPPPPPPAGQAHREEALLVKVKRGNFREGQKCNHTFF